MRRNDASLVDQQSPIGPAGKKLSGDRQGKHRGAHPMTGDINAVKRQMTGVERKIVQQVAGNVRGRQNIQSA